MKLTLTSTVLIVLLLLGCKEDSGIVDDAAVRFPGDIQEFVDIHQYAQLRPILLPVVRESDDVYNEAFPRSDIRLWYGFKQAFVSQVLPEHQTYVTERLMRISF